VCKNAYSRGSATPGYYLPAALRLPSSFSILPSRFSFLISHFSLPLRGGAWVRLYGAAFVVAGQRSYPRPFCLKMPLFYFLLLTPYSRAAPRLLPTASKVTRNPCRGDPQSALMALAQARRHYLTFYSLLLTRAQRRHYLHRESQICS
jgi:hypothetical protein